MTTHAWAEKSRGTWKLEVFFSNEHRQTTGDFFEWILLLHGTKEQPYGQQAPLDDRTKLAVVKNIHASDFADKDKWVEALKQDHQKRVGDENDMKRSVVSGGSRESSAAEPAQSASMKKK